MANTSALPCIQKAQSINEIRKDGFTKNARELRFGQLMLLLQFGNMTKEVANNNTKLYAEKVKPLLSDVWSEWENHWWPKPMSLAKRANINDANNTLAAE